MPARILVIEDNSSDLELIRFLLTAYGHKTLAATNGEEGLEATFREVPDLIISDVQLPRIDGYELARRLKQDPAMRAIPLIAVTAFAQPGDREKLLAAGFDGFIPKPIETERFCPYIDGFLEKELRAGPIRQDEAPLRPSIPSRRSAGRTVLVLESPSLRAELASGFLERSGYTVITAAAHSEALAFARQFKPDLILADDGLPACTGPEFIGVVKSAPDLQGIPCVLLGASLPPSDPGGPGMADDVERRLVRPIEPETLIREIESCLRERQGAS